SVAQEIEQGDSHGKTPQTTQPVYGIPRVVHGHCLTLLCHVPAEYHVVPAGCKRERVLLHPPAGIAPVQGYLHWDMAGNVTEAKVQIRAALAGMAIASIHL